MRSLTMSWRGDQVDRTVRRATSDGLQLAAEHVRGAAVQRTPLDTAALRNSAVASSDPVNLNAAVSYDTPYAVRQHEELSYRHRDGEAKFLERALSAERARVMAIIAAAARRGTR
ncbi:hypothetical protein [Nocardiopsis alba]|uniref:hypothetical protein n=1 Tax=Nocardiopsis alba TaxID=53437 RepID=UPI0035D85EC5